MKPIRAIYLPSTPGYADFNTLKPVKVKIIYWVRIMDLTDKPAILVTFEHNNEAGEVVKSTVRLKNNFFHAKEPMTPLYNYQRCVRKIDKLEKDIDSLVKVADTHLEKLYDKQLTEADLAGMPKNTRGMIEVPKIEFTIQKGKLSFWDSPEATAIIEEMAKMGVDVNEPKRDQQFLFTIDPKKRGLCG